ncbi:amino acid permease-domain-containing protein [Chytriomyces sp. MP71]|nr:amino acid permease-domain-containing protein [Chytriomyces sp. MP71]
MANEKKVEAVVLDSVPEGQHLQRKLKARHLEMIAIGGTIGTGLLLRSGGAIARAGPIGALLCFAIVGLQVFGVASGIGEMCTLLPVEGAFSAMPTRFVNPALGFSGGWNYLWLPLTLLDPRDLDRKGYTTQGRKLEDLPYIAPFYPYADYVSLTIGSVVTVFLFISAFYNRAGAPNWFNTQWFLDNSWTYCGVPLIIVFYIAHGSLKSGFALVKYEDMDFETGRLIETEEEKNFNEALKAKPKSWAEWGQRIWFKLF